MAISKQLKLLITITALTLPLQAVAQEGNENSSGRSTEEQACLATENRPRWCIYLDPIGPPTWNHGDWTIILRSDEMDVDKRASLKTNLRDEYGEIAGWLEINVWNGGSLVTHSANTGVVSSPFYNLSRKKEGWPHCIGNLDRIAVDDEPVQYLATIERGGHCNFIPANGKAIASMKRGTSAKIRLTGQNTVYTFSLNGFTAAMNRAVKTTRP